MEAENKPEAADVVEESGFQESTELELDDLFETGSEDVESDATLTLAELNELSGRTGENAFKSKEDFTKHYGNLKSFVGKKQVEAKPQKVEKPKDEYISRSQMEAILAERDLISGNQTAKENIDLIRAVAKDKGVSMEEAFKALEPTLTAASAYKKEREVGVNSKNRINPMQSQNLNKLAERVVSGDARSEEALVDEWFKGKE